MNRHQSYGLSRLIMILILFALALTLGHAFGQWMLDLNQQAMERHEGRAVIIDGALA